MFDGGRLTISRLEFKGDDVVQSLNESPERILQQIEKEAETISHDLPRETARAAGIKSEPTARRRKKKWRPAETSMTPKENTTSPSENTIHDD